MMTLFLRRSLAALALLAALAAAPADATVTLRVQGRPSTSPIQAFVRVTNSGVPVTGLTSADFTVKIDGADVAIQPADFTLPPAQDPNQHVSVVFVLDYTPSITDNAAFLDALETAVKDFIDAMNPGDMAAIVKFNNDLGPTVVAAFTAIDDGANDAALKAAVDGNYDGRGSNILDATEVGVEQFTGIPLPDGPKAVILFTDGIDTNSSTTSDDVIGSANSNGIPIFTIGVGDPDQNALDLLGGLADDTGGQFIQAPTGQDITDAYASVSALLTSEYLITIPDSLLSAPITDCAEHTLEVTVTGNAAVSTPFTRRQCDTVPDDFGFQDATNVRVSSAVTSNTITISGLEVPAHISVLQGRYSIGCTDTFTSDPGTISDGQTVCVRQTSADQASTARTTTLTIGGVAGTFTTTTRADSGGGGGGGGGGGTTGVPEILVGLGALLLARRRRAA